MPEDTPELEAAVDELHASSLGEFVANRNDLAKQLRTGGDRDAADRVKALAKPSVTAWATNRLVHHHRDAFARFMEGSERTREAQQGSGADLAAVREEHRTALQDLLDLAAAILTGAGNAAGKAQIRAISGNLEALAAGDEATGGAIAGRLTADLSAPGFGAFAGFAIGEPGPTTEKSGKDADKPPGKPAPKAPPRKSAGGKRKTGPAARKTKPGSTAAKTKAKKAATRARATAQKRLAEARQAARDAQRQRESAQRKAKASVKKREIAARAVERAAKMLAEAEADSRAATDAAAAAVTELEAAEAIESEAAATLEARKRELSPLSPGAR